MILFRLGLRLAVRLVLLIVFVIASLVLMAFLLVRVTLGAQPDDGMIDPTLPIRVTSVISEDSPNGLPQGRFFSTVFSLPERDPACVLGLSGDAKGDAGIATDDRIVVTGVSRNGRIATWSWDFRRPGGGIATLPATALLNFGGSVTTISVVLEDLEGPHFGSTRVFIQPCVNHAGLPSNGTVNSVLAKPKALDPRNESENKGTDVSGVSAVPDVGNPGSHEAFLLASDPAVSASLDGDAIGSETGMTSVTMIAPGASPDLSARDSASGASRGDQSLVVLVGFMLASTIVAAVAFVRTKRKNEVLNDPVGPAPPVQPDWFGRLLIDDYEQLTQLSVMIEAVDLPIAVTRLPLRVVPVDDEDAIMVLAWEADSRSGGGKVVRHDLTKEVMHLGVLVDGNPTPIRTLVATPDEEADDRGVIDDGWEEERVSPVWKPVFGHQSG